MESLTQITDACLAFMALTDHQPLRRADAIVLLEGDGTTRVGETARLYHRGFAPWVVVSGGFVNRGGGCFPPEDLVPMILDHGVPRSALIVEDRSKHTRAQVDEVLSLARDRHWSALLIVATHYHIYRAMLTFIGAANARASATWIIPAPVRDVPWFAETPWGTRFDLLDREFEKIAEYAAKGDCASWADGIAYYRRYEQRALNEEKSDKPS